MTILKNMKILIAGEGGQGVQLIAQLLAYAAESEGKKATYIPNFGVEQRGGVSLAFVQISPNPIAYPKFKTADVLVALSDRAAKRVQSYLSKNTIYIYDDSLVAPHSIFKTIHAKMPQEIHHRHFIKNFLAVPALKIAKDKLSEKVFNMIILGTILATIKKVAPETVKEILSEKLAKKFKENPTLEKLDMKALALGIKLVDEEKEELKEPGKHEVIEKKMIYKGKKGRFEHYPWLCKGCGLCIEICPVKALSFTDKLGAFSTPIPKPDMKKCIACEKCEKICPDAAISVEPKKTG
jgi:2-oxoglutarate ferredoxin oxidoreductase subunit gamma